ncbi:hypothetical protein [Flavobacterium orientale]|uniref:J domain-containing protein n=1 Tax=Flavobacterium orientale TaxID=1756020 RepID=A0A916XWX0_9FLAO|nr:hypothetical protein [Flavobacterium orientale]GGD17714.1 hypothetical protein GCM10011343_05550 [Flavobacterium orientale]
MKTYFIYFGIILFLFGVYYLLTNKKRRLRRNIRKKLSEKEGDNFKSIFKNMVFSISKSKELYKSLITKVHPDRFTDDRKLKAEELSARITKFKKNYDELIKLKIEVENFLNQ